MQDLCCTGMVWRLTLATLRSPRQLHSHPFPVQFNLLDRRLWPLVRFFPYTMFTVRGCRGSAVAHASGDYGLNEATLAALLVVN